MNFRNLRLSVKLATGFGALLLVTAISSTFIFTQTEKLSDIERVNTASGEAVDLIDRLTGHFAMARGGTFKVIFSGAASDAAIVEDEYKTIERDSETLQAIFAKDAPQFLSALEKYKAATTSYANDVLRKETALAADPVTRPQALTMACSTIAGPYIRAVSESFADLRAKVSGWNKDTSVAAASSMSQTELVVVVAGLFSLMLGLALCWFISKAIGGPLQAMTGAMRLLAQGAQDVTIPAIGQTDEMGEMAGAVQVFKDAAIEKRRLEAAAVAAEHRAEEDRLRSETARAEAARQLSQVVDGLAAGLDRLAAGDLVNRLTQPFAQDYESLRANFNDAVAQLQETIEVVTANTGAIRSGTGHISSASDDLSRRTEQQAASLEETAAALSEITTAVKKTASGAAHARDVVRVATGDAEKSGEVVARTVQAMSGIEHSSRQIGNIIGVIDEIAFQTNLLALNAGVEAARAGDAGRGFAVVASEVRGLAQRSAEAAKEIKALIRASDEQVKAGVLLVGETGEGLTRIVQQVAEISLIVNEIATSAEEQASGLSQVNIAVTQMDQVTQQNAAMVEEATAATHSLANDSEELARAVSRFQVGGTVQPIAAARAKAAAAPRPALKTVSRGGPVAALRTQVATAVDSWEEF
ncbi:methyl-accepting chemotaxis protein [Beijerinckia sp. L45]|uniref:methyl-accepting chemotaxis protein n=1 Tax=Beijerinckia sp. L45 TaxID=1641855 RepID=UPI00131CBE24|nr:methyl-accepting chemotaxis protein [Beijerinckia sp. L45]